MGGSPIALEAGSLECANFVRHICANYARHRQAVHFAHHIDLEIAPGEQFCA